MAAKKLPDQAYLRECFRYNKRTGTLTWRKRPRHHFATERGWRRTNSQFSWTQAGTVTKYGHIRVRISDAKYLASRVIWKMITGNDPPDHMDHKNHNASDDSLRNIRPATYSENNRNRLVGRNSKLGIKGVWAHGNKYVASLSREYIGVFPTKEQAAKAYCNAAKKKYGAFWSDGLIHGTSPDKLA